MAFMGAFNGGLFLSIALLLILPRANYFMEVSWAHRFPLAYTICSLSFAVLLLIEKVLASDEELEDLNERLE
jgi:hypothetical protein